MNDSDPWETGHIVRWDLWLTATFPVLREMTQRREGEPRQGPGRLHIRWDGAESGDSKAGGVLGQRTREERPEQGKTLEICREASPLGEDWSVQGCEKTTPVWGRNHLNTLGKHAHCSQGSRNNACCHQSDYKKKPNSQDIGKNTLEDLTTVVGNKP